MSLVSIVLFVATLAFAYIFAENVRRMVHRLASAFGFALLLGKPSAALVQAMQKSKVTLFRALPGKRALALYMIYALAWAALWAFAAYHTGRFTLIVGLATYSALTTG
ncbi:MAG: hypothetical protein J7530_12300 [Novosphingobium sp.]|nr:hypothetical protein [Novosphingobium sp.]